MRHEFAEQTATMHALMCNNNAQLVKHSSEAMLALISTQQEILRAVSSSGSMESQLNGVQKQLVAVNGQLTKAATILASLDRAAAEQVVL